MKNLIAAFTIVFVTTSANAEIICTNRGCYETGMKIFNHGGAYSGLPYHNNREMTTNDRGYPQRGKRVRIIREHW